MSGDYIFTYLPPGEYTISFALDGFTTLEIPVVISAAQSKTVDAEMYAEAVREEIVVETDYDKLVPTCIDTRAVKVKIEKIDIPVGYAAAFEGERVRKDDMHVQFGFKYSDSVEYAKMVEPADIQDGDVELIGPDIDTVEPGGAMPMAIEILIAGQSESDERLVSEVADLVYHTLVLLAARNLSWTDVESELAERFGK